MNIHTTAPAQIKMIAVYGHVELRSWFEWRGDRMVGMGQCINYDEKGQITGVKTEPTGLEVSFE